MEDQADLAARAARLFARFTQEAAPILRAAEPHWRRLFFDRADCRWQLQHGVLDAIVCIRVLQASRRVRPHLSVAPEALERVAALRNAFAHQQSLHAAEIDFAETTLAAVLRDLRAQAP